MYLAKFDLNLLVVFDAIYKEKSLTRAGKRLSLSQPAISHALNRLRNAFHNRLFIRQGNLMEPTPFAKELNEGVQKIITLAEKTIQDQGVFDPATSSRTFNICMQDYPMMIILPKLLEHVFKEAPGIEIKVHDLKMEERRKALEEGKIELVIGGRQEYGGNIYQKHLFDDEEVCVMRKDHPVIKDTLSLTQYVEAGFIGLSISDYISALVDTTLEKQGKKRKIRLTVEQELPIFTLVCHTDLLANVAKLLAEQYVNIMPIKILPLPLETIGIPIYQYWHLRHHDEPGHLWLRSKVAEVCRAFACT